MDAYPAGNYMLKVNNRHTRIRSEICSKLTIKTPERCLADNNKAQERTLSVLDINILFFAKRVRKTELKLSQCRCQCQSRFQCLHRGTNVEISKWSFISQLFTQWHHDDLILQNQWSTTMNNYLHGSILGK